MAALVNPKMLKNLREIRKFSQQDLAEKSKVGIATIKRIESADGGYRCQNVQADRLAMALEVDLEDLTEDKMERVINIGGDIEILIDEYTDGDDFRRSLEKVALIIDKRNKILKRGKYK